MLISLLPFFFVKVNVMILSIGKTMHLKIFMVGFLKYICHLIYISLSNESLFTEPHFVIYVGFLDFGDPDYKCSLCSAKMFYNERINKQRNTIVPDFSLCCGHGKVKLPPLQEPPILMKKLLSGEDSRSKHFTKTFVDIT